jgi:PAS domain S-box-containing protein
MENRMRQTQVMIVEDEALVGIDIKNNLTKYGYNVVGVSSSGEDAIEEAAKNKPEIVLMDIHLKGKMDGIETAIHLRKTLGIPTIYLTAYSDDATLTKALKANPYGYLLKPFVPRELHTTIQAALYRSEDEKHVNSEKPIPTQNNVVKKVDLQAEILELQRSPKKEDRKLDRLRYISRNILKRKKFENKIREQSNFSDKMKALLDNFCYVQTIKENVTTAFPFEEFENILGYSKDEILRICSLNSQDLINPEDYPKVMEYYQKTISSSEEVCEIEFRLKHKNGAWKWFSNRSMFLEEEEGIRKNLNIVREITRVKNFEESFFLSQEKLAALSSNPFLGVVILDIKGKILDINPTLEQISGYTKEEILSLSYSDFMSLRGVRSICTQLQKIKSGEIDSFQIESIIYPKYNEAFWGFMVFSIIHDINGLRECLACSIIDISDSRLIEKIGGSNRKISKVN